MTNFSGKIIWIIGASTGIGRALAVELSRRGAVLILSARSAEKLNALKQGLGAAHHVWPLDVTDATAVSAVVANMPVPDSVIYLAGTYQPSALGVLDLTVCKNIVDTNLMGALNIIHGILPIMLRQKNPGQIALCGSVAGYRGLPMAQPYGATKAALINLAESLRAETAERGLDVKIINPGFVRTPMTEKNEFSMPMIMNPADAAHALANGLLSKKFEISFPRRFVILMKILRALPYPLYFKLVKK